MSRSARVTSIATVQRFRNALCEFGKETTDTLCAAELHIRRTMDWLINQGKFWSQQIKVRQEELTRAKIELTSRKYENRSGKGPGSSGQEKAFRRAEARLKEAESKLANCRRWKPLLEHAVQEYQGPARQLGSAADVGLQQAIALLDHKLAALESYLALAPPPGADLAGTLSSTPSSGPVETLSETVFADSEDIVAETEEQSARPAAAPNRESSNKESSN